MPQGRNIHSHKHIHRVDRVLFFSSFFVKEQPILRSPQACKKMKVYMCMVALVVIRASESNVFPVVHAREPRIPRNVLQILLGVPTRVMFFASVV